MDGMRLSFSLAVIFLSYAPAGLARPPGDCSSIFLGSLSDSNAVYIPSTGVFHSLDGTTHNGRPVYQHTTELSYLYFLKSRRSGHRFWAVGREVGSEQPEMAIPASDDDVSNLIPEVTQQQQQKWRLWNNETETWSAVSYLKAVCVDSEFGPCTSGRLRMTGISGRGDLQKRRMGQYVLTNRTHDLRPVYRHETQQEFLFYTTQSGGKWIVGPEVGKVSGGMFVSDFALRPEFIVQTWVVFAGRYFVNDPGVRIKCQGVERSPSESGQPGNPGNDGEVDEIQHVSWLNYGVPNVVDTGTIEERLARGFPFENTRGRSRASKDEEEETGCDSACEHGGHCQSSDPDEFRCICSEHYFGLHCQIDVDCGQPPLVSGQQVVSTTGHYLLDVVFYRCPENTILDGPAGVICQVDGTWTDLPRCLDGHHLLTPMHDENSRTIPGML